MTTPLADNPATPSPRVGPDELTVQQVKAMFDCGDLFFFVDCRTEKEHDLARIEGATLMPLGALAQHLDALEEHGDEPIVVYCHHGIRSLQFTAMLKQQGLQNVKSMAGGIDRWSLEIDPSIARY